MLALGVLLNIVLGLALEAHGASRGWTWAEPLVGLLTSLHLGFHLWRPPTLGGVRIPRVTLVLCLLFATAGELVLSAVFGLYTYRSSVLPFFVPPGHVLLFLAGLSLSRHRVSSERLPWLVPLATLPFLAWNGMRGSDVLSVALFTAFVLCVWRGRERSLYAVMFVLALALELYGTALGAWRWEPLVPGLGWASANPPLAAGAFYAVLDLLAQEGSRRLARVGNSATPATGA